MLAVRDELDVDVDVVCKSAGRSDLLLRKRLRIAVGHDTPSTMICREAVQVRRGGSQ
jgi:hypothetical protein